MMERNFHKIKPAVEPDGLIDTSLYNLRDLLTATQMTNIKNYGAKRAGCQPWACRLGTQGTAHADKTAPRGYNRVAVCVPMLHETTCAIFDIHVTVNLSDRRQMPVIVRVDFTGATYNGEPEKFEM